MDKFRFEKTAYLVIRKADGYVYADFGAYKDFGDIAELNDKPMKLYFNINKIPQKFRNQSYEIKTIEMIFQEV